MGVIHRFTGSEEKFEWEEVSKRSYKKSFDR